MDTAEKQIREGFQCAAENTTPPPIEQVFARAARTDDPPSTPGRDFKSRLRIKKLGLILASAAVVAGGTVALGIGVHHSPGTSSALATHNSAIGGNLAPGCPPDAPSLANPSALNNRQVAKGTSINVTISIPGKSARGYVISTTLSLIPTSEMSPMPDLSRQGKAAESFDANRAATAIATSTIVTKATVTTRTATTKLAIPTNAPAGDYTILMTGSAKGHPTCSDPNFVTWTSSKAIATVQVT